MKKGDKVKYTGNNNDLTKGKIYEVKSRSGEWVRVINNMGEVMGYAERFFIPYPDKVAVHCPTKKLFMRVISKIDVGSWDSTAQDDIECWDNAKEETCVGLDDGGYDGKPYYECQGYTIITASEYLKEGDVKKKIAVHCKIKGEWERVQRKALDEGKLWSGGDSEIYDGWDKYKGESTIGIQHDLTYCGLEFYKREGYHIISAQEYLGETQTNNIKGDTKMKINNSIRKVLVDEKKAPTFEIVEKMQENFGTQIDEDFTGEMNLRNNLDTYLDELKRIDKEKARAEKEANKD